MSFLLSHCWLVEKRRKKLKHTKKEIHHTKRFLKKHRPRLPSLTQSVGVRERGGERRCQSLEHLRKESLWRIGREVDDGERPALALAGVVGRFELF